MRAVVVGLMLLVLVPSCWAQARKSQSREASDASSAERPSREAQDRAGIQKLQERDIAATINNDVDALVSLWTDDGVLMVPGHGPIVGIEALRAFFQQQRDAMANTDVTAYEQEWREVRVLGDYAIQWGQIHGRTRKGQGATENSVTVNAMRILKREEGGSWRISRAIWNQARAGTSIGAEPVPFGERP